MAYTPLTMRCILQSVGGIGGSLWHYTNTDAHTDVDAADYFSDGSAKGMKVHDIVIVVDTDTNTTTIHSVETVTAGGAATINAATLA